MKIIPCPSPNHDARPENSLIDMLVFHYTGMENIDAALQRLCDPAAKVSAHYTIARDGRIFQHVDEACRAWHAGVASWAGKTDINARSIGIELENPGHEFGYIPFADDQMQALISLATEIKNRFAIRPLNILGHSDVAPNRKSDPGELFPWQKLSQHGLGLWPGPAQTSLPSSALPRLGYADAEPDAICAFQRRFRPRSLTGQWDDECGQYLASLLDQAGLIA